MNPSLRLEHIIIIDCGDRIVKNEVGGACSTYKGEDRLMQGFGGET
jgi:hypothetical protein